MLQFCNHLNNQMIFFLLNKKLHQATLENQLGGQLLKLNFWEAVKEKKILSNLQRRNVKMKQIEE